jgi:hypothetical protein
MTNQDLILEVLKRYPEGLDDDQLSQLSGVVPRQQVNQICRRLEANGVIAREAGAALGKIVNRLDPGIPSRLPAMSPPSLPIVPGVPLVTEDDVKRAIRDHLVEDGWTVTVKWDRKPGIDIEAVLGNRVLVIEAKGEVPSQPQMTNYFLGSLGELLQRMDAPSKEYGLALPKHGTYVGLVGRLPLWVKQHLKLQFFFVRRDGDSFIVDHESY